MLRRAAIGDDPDPDSVEIMQQIDAMPPRWRELVREYGFLLVREHYDGDGLQDPDMAEMSLYMLRERRQLDYAVPMFANVIEARLRKYRNG